MQFVGYEALSVTSGAAVGFALIPAASGGNTYADIRVETAAVRVEPNVTGAPTTTVGYPLNAGDALLNVGNLAGIKFIAQSTTATVHALYYVND